MSKFEGPPSLEEKIEEYTKEWEGFVEAVEMETGEREVFESFFEAVRENSNIFTTEESFFIAIDGVMQLTLVEEGRSKEVRDCAGEIFARATEALEEISGGLFYDDE